MGERVFKIEYNRYNPHKNPHKNKYEYLFIILVYKTDLNETFSKCYFKINVISRSSIFEILTQHTIMAREGHIHV